MGEMYRISGERLTAFADQTRRLASVTGTLSPDMMIDLLEGLESAGTMPAAENYIFGEVEGRNEYGIVSIGSKTGPWNNYTGGYEFMPNENLSVAGIRVFAGKTTTAWPDVAALWDADGNLLASGIFYPSKAGSNFMFDSPVNLIAGKNYIVSADMSSMMYCFIANCTINPRITYVAGVCVSGASDSTPTFPTKKSADAIYGIADIIIAEPETPAPGQYVVQLGTMNDIAEEVQRISGTETKMTVEQMRQELSEVILQEKTVTPSTEQQVITPDSGFYGISKVTVGAVEQTESSGSMFSATAVGILPTVYKGAANSEFSLNFESSAVGALSE